MEVRRERRIGAGAGHAGVLISVAGSGGAGLELPLALAQALGLVEVALNPELVPLPGDQLGDGGDLRWHLEGAAEGLGEGSQLRMRSWSVLMVGKSSGASGAGATPGWTARSSGAGRWVAGR